MPGLDFNLSYTPGSGYQSPTSRLDPDDPSDVMANVLREEYNRNIDMYRPLEDYLFENLNRWGDITKSEQNAAYGRSQEMFRLGKESYERDLRSTGTVLNMDERKSLTRQYDIAAAKSAIDAANQTGRGMDDMRLGLVGGFGGYKSAGSN